LAELERAADFSRFPGLDRVFTLATGGPLAIRVAGTTVGLLQGESLAFEGEAEVEARLLSTEPQLGLNLMTRRGISRGSVDAALRNGQVRLNPGDGVVSATLLAGKAKTAEGRTMAKFSTLVMGAQVEHLVTEEALLVIARVQLAPTGSSFPVTEPCTRQLQ
jgi:environmental stress-induced protein Ves